MENVVSTSDLQRLLGVGKPALNELHARGIIKRGTKRGTYQLEESVGGYCRHLREQAAGRGGEKATEARARLGQAQADLAEAKAGQLRGELVEAAEVERVWTTKLRAIRNRILAVPNRVRDLSPRQNVTLTRELRDALAEGADDKAA